MKSKTRILALTALVLAATAGWLPAQNPIPPSPRVPAPRALPTAAGTPAAEPAASSSPAPGGSVPTTASASGDYILAVADTVEMSVFHQPDLTTQARIASDGSVQFPLIGELRIAGVALRDAREMIRKRYNADYLVEPQVYLNVVSYAQHKFTILGQVTTPGTYAIPGGEHLGLLEAVGMAGGFTRLADRSTVEIKRTDQGAEQTFRVNTKKLTGRDGKKFELLPGDVITVRESWL